MFQFSLTKGVGHEYYCLNVSNDKRMWIESSWNLSGIQKRQQRIQQNTCLNPVPDSATHWSSKNASMSAEPDILPWHNPLRQSRHHKIDPLLFLVEGALRFASFQHLLLRDTEATQILPVLSGVLQKQYKTIKPFSKATKEDFLVKCCGKFDWQRYAKAF